MTYVAANNSEVPNRWEIDVEGATEQGHKVNVTLHDAEVGMPILSVGELTDTQHKVDFEDRGGDILHKPTGHRFEFIISPGVYFIQMRVRRSLVEPGLGRPGTA